MSVPDQGVIKNKVYFSGLNGLRFLAAFAVIVHHVEMFKRDRGLPNYFRNILVEHCGHYAVAIFFVLSAFLITYLLLAEYEQTRTIRIKEFYWRRLLRIWPVYYLVVAIVFFVVPHFADNGQVFRQHFGALLAAHIIMLPNLLYMPPVFEAHALAGQHLWSIGIEEQFYLLWPVLMKLFIKHIVKMVLAVIFFKLVFHHFAPDLIRHLGALQFSKKWLWRMQFLYQAIDMIPFEKMGSGAIAAYVVFHEKKDLLKWLYHPVTQGIAYAAAVCLLLLPDYKYLSVVQGGVFAVLIMNIACNTRSLLKLESGYFDYLGKISYGIYMYHSIVIVAVLMALTKVMPGTGVMFNGLLYSLSLSFTLAAAVLSHRYYESYFLALKKKAQIVRSGD